MKEWLSRNWKRYTFAALTLVPLGALFAFLWLNIGIVPIGAEGLFFVTALLLIVAVTKIVFDSFTLQSSRILEENVTYNTALSSHELFAEIYKNSPVPYVIIDREGTIISTNTSALRLFAISAGKYDGKNVFDVIEGEHEQSTSLTLEKMHQNLFVNDEEVKVHQADGKERWALLSLFSFTEDGGDQRGLLTLVDITKQKEVDQAKTEFVSLASHQLRSPISAMKWNMELLEGPQSGELSKEQQVHFKKINSNLMRMETLIEDFLNMSKLELGTLTAKRSVVDVEKLCEGILSDHAGKITTHTIQIKKTFGPDVHAITSDTHLLHMILNNLISNAVKYTPDGGVVSIKCGIEDGALVVTVSDTGIGIPKDDQEKIFTKIYRASNAEKQISEGTGLGLYIARQAAGVLGGTITFESEQDRGTTFMVRLPV